LPDGTHVGRVETQPVIFPIPTTNAHMFEVTLNVFSACGFDYTPRPTSNGTHFSFGDLSPITIQFSDRIVGEEKFNIGVTAVHKVIHNVMAENWVSPFTALFEPTLAGLLPGHLPVCWAVVEYTKYYPPSYVDGRTQAVFLLRAQRRHQCWGANFFIDRAGTASDSLCSFLSEAVSAKIIERGYTEDFCLVNEKRSKVSGSGFSANILLGGVSMATPIREP